MSEMSEQSTFQPPHVTEAEQALEKERHLPLTGWQQEVSQGLTYGLEAADSIRDRSIPTFSRGELPHYAGINTFMKAPYLEDVRNVGNYDVAILGVPHDSGTTYRPGTRFGPQGIRRISALYTPYNFELGVDLREQITLCDLGDIFTIPANIPPPSTQEPEESMKGCGSSEASCIELFIASSLTAMAVIGITLMSVPYMHKPVFT